MRKNQVPPIDTACMRRIVAAFPAGACLVPGVFGSPALQAGWRRGWHRVLASRVHDKILIATGAAKAVCSVVGESARRRVINSIAPAMAAPQQAKDGCNLAGSFSLHSPI